MTQSDAGPVGSVEVMTPPEPLVVTQSSFVGHEMLVRLWPPATSVSLHEAVWLAGCFVVSTSPSPSAATHSFAVGHEMPSNG